MQWDALLEVCKTLEWSGHMAAGWWCCPICHGIDPTDKKRDETGLWLDSAYGHRTDCKLAAVIADLESVREVQPPVTAGR